MVRFSFWISLAFVWFTVSPSLLLAQAHLRHLEHFGLDDGLSHSTVRSVVQDAEGFLWIATESHVQRYDGIELRAFKHDPDDLNTLSESQVMTMMVDRHDRLWLGTRQQGINLWLPELERFKRFEPRPDDPGRLSAGMILHAVAARDGSLWVATPQGLNRLDPETGRVSRFLHDPERADSLRSNTIFSLAFDAEDRLWILHQRGLDRLDDPPTGPIATLGLREESPLSFRHYTHDPEDPGSLPTSDLGFLRVDSKNRLWIGTWDGRLSRYEASEDAFRTWDPGPTDPYPARSGSRGIGSLIEDGDGNLWLGTRGRGVLSFDVERETFAWFRHRPGDSRSLADDRIWSIFEDRSRVLWFSTEQGLSFQARSRERFAVRRQGETQGQLLDDTVSALAEDEQGRLWVGFMGGGVALFKDELLMASWHAGEGGPEGFVRAFEKGPDGAWWVVTKQGLLRLDGPSTARGTGSFQKTAIEGNFNDMVAAFGSLWLAGTKGLVHASFEGEEIRRFPVVEGGPRARQANTIYALRADDAVPGHAAGLWLVTEGGFFHFDPAARRMTEIGSPPTRKTADESRTATAEAPEGPSSLNLVALHRDGTGAFWLGSYGGGLNRWQPDTDTWTHFHEKDGLPSDKVVGILEQEGLLWLATNDGLSRFDPRTGTFRNYSVGDGLHGNVTFIGTVLKRRSGELVIGGPGGLTHFDPQALVDDPVVPELSWNRLYVSDEPVPIRSEGLLRRSLAFTDSLVLNHRHRTVGFEPVALHFADPDRNRYAYQLEGYDDDWIEVDARHRRARYTNLPAGEYRFRFKAANKDGVWTEGEESLGITVLPPPWKTWWAYTLYVLSLVGIVFAYIRRQQNKLRREQAVNARLREVDRLKDELLSNTSHELRTPLQGILGLTESLLENSDDRLGREAREDLGLVLASGRRLGMLVDDLLDFSKLDQSELSITRRPVDLHSMVEVALTVSRPLLGARDLELINDVPLDLPALYGDERRLVQVLNNLIGNAVKFTEKGYIRVQADRVQADRASGEPEEGPELIRISVQDTGIGIEERYLEDIFEPFRQIEGSKERRFGGTGLGLAVSRRLVELHDGEISVESKLGQGSTFSITLPTAPAEETAKSGVYRVLKTDAFTSSDASGTMTRPPSPTQSTDSKILVQSSKTPAPSPGLSQDGRILVVDDEAINRRVLGNFLSAEGYTVRTVGGGEEALRLIADPDESFDLVLLDIMMPFVSGYDVCRQERQWMSLEELPIIFLSAKIQPSDVVVGLAHGANDFLLKPISKAELLARIRPHLALLEIYRRLGDLVTEQVARIRVLSGLLPMCSSCKSIRNDEGYWEDVSSYLAQHSEVKFSHGICPNCVRKQYGDLQLEEPLM